MARAYRAHVDKAEVTRARITRGRPRIVSIKFGNHDTEREREREKQGEPPAIFSSPRVTVLTMGAVELGQETTRQRRLDRQDIARMYLRGCDGVFTRCRGLADLQSTGGPAQLGIDA